MDANHMSLEVDLSQRRFSIDGSPDFIREWFDRLWPEFSGGELAKTPHKGKKVDENDAASQSRQVDPSPRAMPETFGEYYHFFSGDLTDQDRVLIASHFIQQTSTDNSFSTGAANELLRSQGVRVANPSQSIRRLRDARRVFPVANGLFRVSETGVRYLETLRQQAVQD